MRFAAILVSLSPDEIALRNMLAAERAADAAERAVYWSNVQTVIATLAFIISFVSIALALYALIQGIESLKHQTNAARQQLRAYVSVDYERIEDFGPSKVVRGFVRVTNKGLTPAKDFTAACHADYFVGKDYPTCAEESPTVAMPVIDLMPNQSQTPFRDFYPLTAEQCAEIEAGRAGLCVSGHLFFRDIYGVTRKVVFSHLYDGPELKRRWQDPKMNYTRKV